MTNKKSPVKHIIDIARAGIRIDRAEMYGYMPCENIASMIFIAVSVLLQMFEFKDPKTLVLLQRGLTTPFIVPLLYCALKRFHASWMETKETGWRSYIFNLGNFLALTQIFIALVFVSAIKNCKNSTFLTAGIIVSVVRFLRISQKLIYCRMEEEKDFNRLKYVCISASPALIAFVLHANKSYLLPGALIASGFLLTIVELFLGEISEKPTIDGIEVVPGIAAFLFISFASTMIQDNGEGFSKWLRDGNNIAAFSSASL